MAPNEAGRYGCKMTLEPQVQCSLTEGTVEAQLLGSRKQACAPAKTKLAAGTDVFWRSSGTLLSGIGVRALKHDTTYASTTILSRAR